jgi:hypothetical protein
LGSEGLEAGFVELRSLVDGPLEVGASSDNSIIEGVASVFGGVDIVATPKVLEWALDSTVGKRFSFSDLNPRFTFHLWRRSRGKKVEGEKSYRLCRQLFWKVSDWLRWGGGAMFLGYSALSRGHA